MLACWNSVTHEIERVEQSGLYPGPECNERFQRIVLETHYKRSKVDRDLLAADIMVFHLSVLSFFINCLH